MSIDRPPARVARPHCETDDERQPVAVHPLIILLAEKDDADGPGLCVEASLRNAGLTAPIFRCHDSSAVVDALDGALSAVREERPPCLVFLDLASPRLAGLEVLAFMSSTPALSLIPTIVFTSLDAGPSVEQCYRLGANFVIVKPDNAETFTVFATAISAMMQIIRWPS